MKTIVFIAFLVHLVSSEPLPYPSVYGYLGKDGVSLAEKIRDMEKRAEPKIVGGVPAALAQYPWQAGLIINITGLDRQAVCGASLVSTTKILTAAHCWTDGIFQASLYTVVLGSVNLFSGGERIKTSAVVTHPRWFPFLVRNDVAIASLPESVKISEYIKPIALPSGVSVDKDFEGASAIASGFGLTSGQTNVDPNQSLSHVSLRVISNKKCSYAFPFIIRPGHLCTSGFGGHSVCSGDSGGPLVTYENKKPVLIGITSFASGLGCESYMPAGFTRVTHHLEFINSQL